MTLGTNGRRGRSSARRLAGDICASLREALDHATGKRTGAVMHKVEPRDRRPQAPIKSSRDHGRALKEIERLMDAKHGTPEGERLDLLARLVEAWETKHSSGHSNRRGSRRKTA